MRNFLYTKAQLFFAVNVLACIGLNIGVIGVNWFVISSTGENRLLGLYGAVSLVSAFFTLALASTFTDRYSKLSLLRFCCVGQSFLFFLTALLSSFKIPVIWIIYGLALFNMPLMVLFSVVSRGIIPSVWQEKDLSKGNAVLEITLQIGAVCAALLTGFLYHVFGFSVLLNIGGLLCLSAGGLLFCWPASIEEHSNKQSARYWKDLKEGLLYLTKNVRCLIYGLIAFIPTIVISVSNTVFPGYVEQALGAGVFSYALGDTFFSVGALISGLLGIRVGQYKKFCLIPFLFASTIAGLGVLAVGKNVLLFYIVVFFLGISLAGLRILLNSVFMEKTNPLYLGRVLSLLMALSMAIQAVLSYIVGSYMDKRGASNGFLVLLFLSVAGLVCLFLTESKRDK